VVNSTPASAMEDKPYNVRMDGSLIKENIEAVSCQKRESMEDQMKSHIHKRFCECVGLYTIVERNEI